MKRWKMKKRPTCVLQHSKPLTRKDLHCTWNCINNECPIQLTNVVIPEKSSSPSNLSHDYREEETKALIELEGLFVVENRTYKCSFSKKILPLKGHIQGILLHHSELKEMITLKLKRENPHHQ